MVKFFDRVKEVTATLGTGTLALSGAAAGYRAFSSVLSNGDTCYYTITEGTQWEVGLGSYNANTLTRATVYASSNAGFKIVLATGAAEVFLDLPASYIATGEQTTNKGQASGYAGLDGNVQLSAYQVPRPILASMAQMFDPATFFYNNGLAAWWDARTYATKMVDDGGGLISAWTDRVSGITVTAAGAARPTYSATGYAGKACVTGDGVNTAMSSAVLTNLPTGANPSELWASFFCPSGYGASGILVAYGASGAGNYRQLFKSATYRTTAANGATTVADKNVSLADSFTVANAQFSDTTLNAWADDYAFYTNPQTISPPTTGSSSINLFSTTSSTFPLAGSIRHVMIFNRVLTDDERHLLYQWLAVDAGIPTSLGPDNYYNTNALSLANQAEFSSLPAYFTPADVTLTLINNLRVWMLSGFVPASNAADATTYAYWPGSDIASQSMANIAASTWTNGRMWGLVWANRRTNGPLLKAPNPIYPPILTSIKKTTAIEYSSIAKANAATKVRCMHRCGYTSAEYNAVADAAGFNHATDILTRATLAASPDTYFTGSYSTGTTSYATMTDKIYLDDTVASNMYGIFLDHECQDTRSTAETTAFLTDLATTVQAKGKKLFIYTNPLNGNTAPLNGMDATNCPTLLAAVDYFTIFIVNGANAAASYAAQSAILGNAYPDKVALLYDCAAPLATATDVRALVLANAIKNVVFFPDRQPVGGSDPTSQVNAAINRIVFGV